MSLARSLARRCLRQCHLAEADHGGACRYTAFCITCKRNLNPQSRNRTYPRVVKRAPHNSYRVKKPSDKGTRHHGRPTIVLVNLPAAGSTLAKCHWVQGAA